MKLLKHMLIGAVIGGALGFAAPAAYYKYYLLTHSGFDGGGGTVFSLMMIFTIPGGIGLGLMAGAAFGVALRD